MRGKGQATLSRPQECDGFPKEQNAEDFINTVGNGMIRIIPITVPGISVIALEAANCATDIARLSRTAIYI